MFDFMRIADSVGQMIGLGDREGGMNPSSFLEQLGTSGLDLSNLQGLDAEGLMGLLEQNGIDLAGLLPEQITQLQDLIASGANPIEALQSLLGQNGG